MGGRSPPKNNLMFIAALCGGAAWTANVNISKRGVGKPGFPTPPPRRGMGKPGFPMPPPGGRVWEGAALPRSMFILSVCGGAAWTANVNIGCWSRGMGKPGFPTPPPLGREGAAFEQGYGETGFPHTPTRGKVWEGCA